MDFKIPDGFRYSCEIEEFKKIVSEVKDLIDKNQAYFLFGCIKDTKFCYDEKVIDISLLSENFDRIIGKEIIPMMEECFENSFDEESLREFLEESHEDGEIDEEEIEKIIISVKGKYSFVEEHLINSTDISRYYFKKEIIGNKLGKLDYNYNKYLFNDGKEIKYAHVKMTVMEKLVSESLPKSIAELIQDKSNVIDFICDRNDLDYIIKMLESIKENI